MFVNPNGVEILRQSNRCKKTGLFTQSELMLESQSGYSCIRVLLCGIVLLPSGGISE